MQIDHARLDPLESQLAAKRGQYDAARDALAQLKPINAERHNLYWGRLFHHRPGLAQSPRAWMEQLSDDEMKQAGVSRSDVEELSVSMERASRLVATIEKTGNELQPLIGLVGACRKYIEQQRGGVTL